MCILFSFNEDKEKDKGADRWSRLTSMVEAKLAAQYLFDTAAEVVRGLYYYVCPRPHGQISCWEKI